MSELTTYAKERRWRTDLRCFGKAVWKHWAEIAGGTFEPGLRSDAQSKTLKPKSQEFVNVIVFHSSKPRFGMLRNNAQDVKSNFEELLDGRGDYGLTVQIASQTATETIELKFTYTGQLETSKLEKL